MAAALGQAQGALSSHGDSLDSSTNVRPSLSKLWFEYIFYSYVKKEFCLSVCMSIFLSVNTFSLSEYWIIDGLRPYQPNQPPNTNQ